MAIIKLSRRIGQNSPYTPQEQDSDYSIIEAFAASVTPSGTGTVTSVGLSAPNNIFGVANSPIIGAGTISITLANQSPNTFFAGVISGTGVPTFRAIVLADIPNITVIKGGTGLSAVGTAYQLFRTNSTGTANEYATVQAGSTKITVTPGAGTIAIDVDPTKISITALQGTATITQGGSGASTAQGARIAIMPSIVGNSLKSIRVNVGETDFEYYTPTGGITSINADTTAAQTIVKSAAITAANGFDISTIGGVTTIYNPPASATVTGPVNVLAQIFAGQKTFNTAPIINTLIPQQVIYAGSSIETVGDAAFLRNRTNKYLAIEEIIDSKTATLTADATLDINYWYVRMEQSLANTNITLPLISSVPIGKEFIIKDSLGRCVTRSISIIAQGGNRIEQGINGTVRLATTAFSCIRIKAVDSGAGGVVWELVSVYGVLS